MPKKKPKLGLMVLKQMSTELEHLASLVDFFQVPGEEYFGPQTIQDIPSLVRLSKLRPIHIHSIDLSIGSFDGPERDILKSIESVLQKINPVSFSDHIGFSKVNHYWTGMPILNSPLTYESANKTVENIEIIRQTIGDRAFFIENNSRCIDWKKSDLSEAEYINYISEKSGADILLDLPNMLADAKNYNFNPYEFINSLNKEKIKMIHIAGGDWLDGYRENKITRGHYKPVEQETWEVLRYVIDNLSPDFIVLERSRDIVYKEIESDLLMLKKLCH